LNYRAVKAPTDGVWRFEPIPKVLGSPVELEVRQLVIQEESPIPTEGYTLTQVGTLQDGAKIWIEYKTAKA
jgi:hypothetical protein